MIYDGWSIMPLILCVALLFIPYLDKLSFHRPVTHSDIICFFYSYYLHDIVFLFQASTIDGRRKGACLFCQEYFMDLYLLAELKTISLKVSYQCFYLLRHNYIL